MGGLNNPIYKDLNLNKIYSRQTPSYLSVWKFSRKSTKEDNLLNSPIGQMLTVLTILVKIIYNKPPHQPILGKYFLEITRKIMQTT